MKNKEEETAKNSMLLESNKVDSSEQDNDTIISNKLISRIVDRRLMSARQKRISHKEKQFSDDLVIVKSKINIRI